MTLDILEHHYTSSPVGRSGSSGFQTVAWSQALTGEQLKQLDNLSVYSRPSGSAEGGLPIIYGYHPLDEQTIAISRVEDANVVDDNSRPIPYARHVVLQQQQLLEIDYDIFSLIRDERLFSPRPAELPARFAPRSLDYTRRAIPTSTVQVNSDVLALVIEGFFNATARRPAHLFVASPDQAVELCELAWMAIPIPVRAEVSFRTFVDQKYGAGSAVVAGYKGAMPYASEKIEVDATASEPNRRAETRYASKVAQLLVAGRWDEVARARAQMDGLGPKVTTALLKDIEDVEQEVERLAQGFTREGFEKAVGYIHRLAQHKPGSLLYLGPLSRLLAVPFGLPMNQVVEYQKTLLKVLALTAGDRTIEATWVERFVEGMAHMLAEDKPDLYGKVCDQLVRALGQPKQEQRKLLIAVADRLVSQAGVLGADESEKRGAAPFLEPTLRLACSLPEERRDAALLELLFAPSSLRLEPQQLEEIFRQVDKSLTAFEATVAGPTPLQPFLQRALLEQRWNVALGLLRYLVQLYRTDAEAAALRPLIIDAALKLFQEWEERESASSQLLQLSGGRDLAVTLRALAYSTEPSEARRPSLLQAFKEDFKQLSGSAAAAVLIDVRSLPDSIPYWAAFLLLAGSVLRAERRPPPGSEFQLARRLIDDAALEPRLLEVGSLTQVVSYLIGESRKQIAYFLPTYQRLHKWMEYLNRQHEHFTQPIQDEIQLLDSALQLKLATSLAVEEILSTVYGHGVNHCQNLDLSTGTEFTTFLNLIFTTPQQAVPHSELWLRNYFRLLEECSTQTGVNVEPSLVAFVDWYGRSINYPSEGIGFFVELASRDFFPHVAESSLDSMLLLHPDWTAQRLGDELSKLWSRPNVELESLYHLLKLLKARLREPRVTM